MRRIPRRMALAITILVVALLCGTAYAIITHYSVRDYQAGGQPSAEFERHIVELDQTCENDYITLTMGDAVFDGSSVAVAMNLYSKDEDKPVYLVPKLVGYCGDRKLDIDVQGMRGLDQSGFFYPNPEVGDVLDHRYGIDAALYEDAADSAITWTFTLDVLVPRWPVVVEPNALDGSETRADFEAYMQRFRDAYANRQILTLGGENLAEYETILPKPDGMTDDEWNWELTLPERLVRSGAFTLADTIECSFATELPEMTTVSDQTYELPGYTVRMRSLAVSFMSLSFELERVYSNAEAVNGTVYDWYELRDESGNALEAIAGGMQEDANKMYFNGTANLRYQHRIDPITELPARLTFVPMGWANGAELVYDEANAFTVALPVGE